MVINSGSTRTLFCTPQYVVDNTFINDNSDVKLIKKAIRTAEDKYILPIIGGTLYNTIISKIQSNTLTGDYKNVVDNFIIPCLLEYTVYEYVPYVFKFRNKGVSKQTSETSEPATQEELIFVRENILQTAQFYGEELIRHLRCNSNLYPEYNQSATDQIPPAQGDYFSGIFIPNVNRSDCDGFGQGYTTNIY